MKPPETGDIHHYTKKTPYQKMHQQCTKSNKNAFNKLSVKRTYPVHFTHPSIFFYCMIFWCLLNEIIAIAPLTTHHTLSKQAPQYMAPLWDPCNVIMSIWRHLLKRKPKLNKTQIQTNTTSEKHKPDNKNICENV